MDRRRGSFDYQSQSGGGLQDVMGLAERNRVEIGFMGSGTAKETGERGKSMIKEVKPDRDRL